MFKLNRTHVWLGAGAMLLAGLNAGCRHMHHNNCSTCEPRTACTSCCADSKSKVNSKAATAVATDAHKFPTPPTVAHEPVGQSPPISNERFVLPERSPAVLPEPIPSPAVVTAQKPKPELPPPPAVEPKKEQETVVIPSIGNEATPRRSFADITAKPQFGHAADYAWLTGELWHNSQKDEWRLRFASIDEEDRYGGSVTLDARAELKGYKSGQLVRVDGSLIDPESREIAPKYRVKEVRLLGQ